MTTEHIIADTELPNLHASPDFAQWLHQMNGSLVLSTYQSGRIFLSFQVKTVR